MAKNEKARVRLSDLRAAARGDKGIRCPKCACPLVPVVYTRDALKGRRRARQCDNCGHRFPTFESTGPPPPVTDT